MIVQTEVIIGVDVGTGAVKVAAFGVNGAPGELCSALDVLAPGVARAPSATGETRRPIGERTGYYRARKQEYQALYDAAVAQV